MRFGTVGTSWITDSFIEASKETNDLKLTAVHSRSKDKAKRFANKHNAKYFFTDLEQMANCEAIDCIYIASPNSLHYEQTITFLKHKKHVICEKPIFSNTRELEVACETAEENGVYLFEAIRSIHSPNFAQLKRNLEKAGKVRGSILHRSRYSSQYNNYLAGKNPNVFSLEYSGGALVDMGIYPLYVAVALFGKPNSVSYTPVILDSGVDGNGTLILKYDGFTCTVICSKISTSYIPCEIQGESGTLSFENAAKIIDLTFVDNQSKQETLLGTDAADQDMIYEIQRFAEIMKADDKEAYQRLKKLSLSVLKITEEARRQNNIVYHCEK